MTTTLWQNYEIDPLNLIGKTVRITVVTNKGATRGGRWGEGHYYFGVVQSIHEHRGRVFLDDPGDNWAEEAISVDFADTYPCVLILLRGGERVKFDPERDAASIEWIEAVPA